MVASITGQAGRDFVLKVSDGTSPTTYTTIGGLRNTQLTINGNPVDVTNVASNGWREHLGNAGIKDVQISADGIMDTPSNAGFTQLNTGIFNGTSVECQVVSGHGDSIFGTFFVTNLQRAGGPEGSETFNISITSDGTVLYAG